MGIVRIQQGDKEPVEVLAVDAQRQPLTGLSNLKLRVRRSSDDWFLDWSDNTFKLPGSVTTLLQSLTEVNSSVAPGKYHLATLDHPLGFDTAKVTNPTADDNLFFTVIQDGSPQNVSNVPQIGEVKIDQWVENIDYPISGNASPSEVQAVLESLRLDELVASDPGATPPTPGTFIDQILDKLDEKPGYLTLQTYSYDQTADRLDGIVWVEHANLIYNSPNLVDCTVAWYDKDGNLAFSVTDSSPDAQGFFKIEKTNPGLVSDRLYYATATVTITGVGSVSGGKGTFTF